MRCSAFLVELVMLSALTSSSAFGQSVQTPSVKNGPPPDASAWMRVPTPYTERLATDVPQEVRSERDRIWDDLIGNHVPLTDPRRPGHAMSEGDMSSDAPELPDVPNRTILTAVFTKYRSILSASERTIYTEVTLQVDEVFDDRSSHTVAHGQDIVVILAGGTIALPPGRTISDLVMPRSMFLQPHKKYLLVLSYRPSGDFYTPGDWWDISDGTVRAGSVRSDAVLRLDHSTLIGIKADQLGEALSALLSKGR